MTILRDVVAILSAFVLGVVVTLAVVFGTGGTYEYRIVSNDLLRSVNLSLLNGPFGGALLAGLTALSVFLLTQRHQGRLEVIKDARALRDARRERLRANYEQVLLIMQEMRIVAQQIPKGGPQEPYPKLAVAVENVNLLQVRLILEGAIPVTRRVGVIINLLPRVTATEVGSPEREALAEEMRTLVVELANTMTAALHDLGVPMSKLPDPQSS